MVQRQSRLLPGRGASEGWSAGSLLIAASPASRTPLAPASWCNPCSGPPFPTSCSLLLRNRQAVRQADSHTNRQMEGGSETEVVEEAIVLASQAEIGRAHV